MQGLSGIVVCIGVKRSVIKVAIEEVKENEQEETKTEEVEANNTVTENSATGESAEQREEVVSQAVDNADGATIEKLCEALRDIKQEVGALKDSMALFIDSGATVVENVDYSQDLNDEEDMPKIIEDLNL